MRTMEEVRKINGQDLCDETKHYLSQQIEGQIGGYCKQVSSIITENPFIGVDTLQLYDIEEELLIMKARNTIVFSVYEILIHHVTVRKQQLNTHRKK